MLFEEYSHFFEVRLDLFDGPIDLLLHLVKQRELPIEKVSLAEVASQYLSCIENARRFDLEVAGEYLVIAATLLSIKSSVLLGEPVSLIEDEEGNLVNPHDELLRRLREAEVYRESARQLGSRALLGIDVFHNPAAFDEIEPPGPVWKDHDPMLLGKAFKKLLEQAKENASYEISVEAVSIVDTMMSVVEKLREAGGAVNFTAVVPDVRSYASIIATFLALLELCRRQFVFISQEETFGDITVALSMPGQEGAQLTQFYSEFDDQAAAGNA